MKISILGAGGFLGRKLAARIAAEGVLRRPGQAPVAVTGLTLFDIAAPPAPVPGPHAVPIRSVAGDVAALPREAIPDDTDIVFQLAAVVSAAAEADYELGRRVNLRGVDAVIDTCRRLQRPPRVIFTSSVASFSGGQGAVLGDDARQVPANSYGVQKAIGELLFTDASRRGFCDAVSLRLPTIAIRPGRPNLAASSFVSAIVREPLLGLPADLPVPDDFAVWLASPRRCIEWLLHAAVMDTAVLSLDRSLNLPGMSATVADLVQALEAAKPGASALIRRRPDPTIAAIVGTWAPAFDAARARSCGFAPHEPLLDVVRAFIEDDLEATRRDRAA